MAEGVRCVTRISLVVAAFFAVAPAPAQPSSPASVAVCFTPPVGCAERIVEAIGSARREVLVQAYEFTCRPSCRRWSQRTAGEWTSASSWTK